MAGLPEYSATDPEPSDAEAGLIKSYADVDKPHNLPLSKCYWFLPIKGDPGILGGGLFPLLLERPSSSLSVWKGYLFYEGF